MSKRRKKKSLVFRLFRLIRNLIILILIAVVAAFTMISGLLIIILERTQMIGILKAQGLDNGRLRHVFLWVALFAAILTASMTLTSCGDDEDDDVPTPTGIEGTYWKAKSLSAKYFSLISFGVPLRPSV